MTKKTEDALRKILKFQYKWQPPMINDLIRVVKKEEAGK